MTPQQQKLLSLIAEKDICPSYEELMVSMGYKSKSNIHRLVSQLEALGKIFRLKGCARSIEVVKEAQSEHLAQRNTFLTEQCDVYAVENARLRRLVKKLGG